MASEKAEVEAIEAEKADLGNGIVQNDAEHIANSHVRAVHTLDEKNLLKKADWLILPVAAIGYFVAYLDRNSIGNAVVMGLNTDIPLDANQYYNSLTMLWVGYIATMLPVNLLNRKLKPHVSLAFGCIFWGAICAGMSHTENYATMMVLRTLEGVGQAFVQTINLYTSLWYKRDELATRNAIFYSFATFSGSLGGLIAYGIDMRLSTTGPFRPWGWLFLIEGCIAMGVGVIIFFVMPRYPDDLQKRKLQGKKHWLFNDRDIDTAAERFARFNTAGESFKPAQLKAVFKDPKTYMFALQQGAAVLGISNLGAFLPTFIQQFGYSRLNTQLFTIIPYACAALSVLTFPILSDRFQMKAPFLLGAFTMGIVGYIILLCTANPVAGIVASCLVTAACYVPVNLLPVWMFINTAGYTKRAATWPVCEIVGQCFAIMGTRIYDSPPRFFKGHSVVLAINILAATCTVVSYFYMRHENRRKDRIEREYAERGELHPHIADGLTLEHVQDQHISFRYLL